MPRAYRGQEKAPKGVPDMENKLYFNKWRSKGLCGSMEACGNRCKSERCKKLVTVAENVKSYRNWGGGEYVETVEAVWWMRWSFCSWGPYSQE